MMSESGRTYGRENINKKTVENQNKIISEAGHIPLNPDRQLKPTTLHDYAAELAMNNNLSLIHQDQHYRNYWCIRTGKCRVIYKRYNKWFL